MKPFITAHILCFWFISLSNAQLTEEKNLYQAADLTPEHLFTAGIEGPAIDKDGNLFVVNFQKEGTIGIITPGHTPELFVTLPDGSTGNGIRFNQMGEMVVADYTGHNILKINPATKTISVFAHEASMNQPNDIAIMTSGIIFASDPNWKDSTGNLWRIDQDGNVTRLEKNMGTTNGVEVSPDQKHLYVNESVQRNVWVYDLDEQGNISGKKLFYHFNDFGMDGMRCDKKGNLYIARYGKGIVSMLSKRGKLLREIALKGSKPTNVTFGGRDRKTMYVTLQDRGAVEYFFVSVSGWQ
ncbi:MAG TPA: SMP-30/gluconolactonase/LRE family protein [Chitinophagales bacterium]|nr:SMP-30/gluconolactonase/LRE family protein [Chitinophagales bacterium]